MTHAHRIAETPPPHEVVPEALREWLHWDFRHDAVSPLIVDEFNLTLPRDRELIRQLAQIRVQQGAAHVMPFGKYKGRLVEEILVDDPNYVDWLSAQDWFRAEFPALYEVFINFYADEPDIPEFVPRSAADDAGWFILDDSRDYKTVWGRWHDAEGRA